jgi:hypothetical protein
MPLRCNASRDARAVQRSSPPRTKPRLGNARAELPLGANFQDLAHVRACVTPPKSGGCALERVRVEEPAQRTCVPDSLSRMTVPGRDLSLIA